MGKIKFMSRDNLLNYFEEMKKELDNSTKNKYYLITGIQLINHINIIILSSNEKEYLNNVVGFLEQSIEYYLICLKNVPDDKLTYFKLVLLQEIIFGLLEMLVNINE